MRLRRTTPRTQPTLAEDGRGAVPDAARPPAAPVQPDAVAPAAPGTAAVGSAAFAAAPSDAGVDPRCGALTRAILSPVAPAGEGGAPGAEPGGPGGPPAFRPHALRLHAAGAPANAVAARAPGADSPGPAAASPGAAAGGALPPGSTLDDAARARLLVLSESATLHTSADALARIDEVARILVAAGDTRAIFPVAYRVITTRARQAVAEGEFVHGTWADDLIVRFAQRYFDNLHGELAGGAVSPAWQAHYESARRPDATAPQMLGTGIFAHLVDDLPQTLADLKTAPDQEADFERFGLVLLEVYDDLIADIRRDCGTDVSSLLSGFFVGKWVDGVFGQGSTTRVLFQSIRQKAWIMGQRLQKDCSDDVARFEMAQSLSVLNLGLRVVG